MREQAHPICQNYLEACQQLGLPLNDDFNAARFEGAGIYEANIQHGERASSAVAYLHPAMTRANLTVETTVRPKPSCLTLPGVPMGLRSGKTVWHAAFLPARK
jgi:choline dehydrogenase-like flavoprotein